MEFGQVDSPRDIDYTLPIDSELNKKILRDAPPGEFRMHLGLPTFGRNFLKDFYPKGTTDELHHYAQRIHTIEFNGTYFNIPPASQIESWRERSGPNLVFCPKIPQSISHYRQLVDTRELVDRFCDSVLHFEEQLGMAFLQLSESFSPKNWGKIKHFVETFPRMVPLAVELRHPDFYLSDTRIQAVQEFFAAHRCTWLISDTAGRRDAVHMRLSTPDCFVRFNCTHDDETDLKRLEDWAYTLKDWREQGLQNAYFFVHQAVQKEHTFYIQPAAEIFNRVLGLDLDIPVMAEEWGGKQTRLF